jgi:p-aminobenzoyl-glutamate transporter AbgT
MACPAVTYSFHSSSLTYVVFISLRSLVFIHNDFKPCANLLHLDLLHMRLL